MARDGYILVILLGVPMNENIKCKTNDRKKELNKMIYTGMLYKSHFQQCIIIIYTNKILYYI